MVSQLCLMCGSTLNCQTLCLGARPWYSLVVDKDVKKPTNQPTLKARVTYWVLYRKFKYLQRQWLHFPWIKDKNDKILVRKIRLPNHLVMSQNSLEMVSFTMLNILFWLSLQVNLQNTAFGKSATEKAMSVGEITNELKIMKEEMRHPNIVRYYKTFELGEEWYFLPFFLVLDATQSCQLSDFLHFFSLQGDSTYVISQGYQTSAISLNSALGPSWVNLRGLVWFPFRSPHLSPASWPKIKAPPPPPPGN